jgi:hypothetical protein
MDPPFSASVSPPLSRLRPQLTNFNLPKPNYQLGTKTSAFTTPVFFCNPSETGLLLQALER